MKANYYPHIDGLRAVAVLAIILFHLDVKYFIGGYVGVDIFFVISGFLITSLLKREMDINKTINFKQFYFHHRYDFLYNIHRLTSTKIYYILRG